MTENREVGRLALRVEGPRWVAYFAQTHTMDDALEIGSMSMAIVKQNPELKEPFKDLMKSAMSSIIHAAMGKETAWNPGKPAPEHEKAGHA